MKFSHGWRELIWPLFILHSSSSTDLPVRSKTRRGKLGFRRPWSWPEESEWPTVVQPRCVVRPVAPLPQLRLFANRPRALRSASAAGRTSRRSSSVIARPCDALSETSLARSLIVGLVRSRQSEKFTTHSTWLGREVAGRRHGGGPPPL